MDSRLAESLEALSAYVQTQKSLFSRAEADIERLRKLRADVLTQPKNIDIDSNLNDPGLRLSEQHEYFVSSIPNKLHWQVFSSGDPTPLRTFAIRTRLAHTERSVPHTTQHSPLSTLQQFVKDSRRIIIDPVVGILEPDNALYLTSNYNLTTSPFHPSLDPPALSEDEDQETESPPAKESFTAVRRREHAHPNIQKFKERRIRSDALAERGECADAVFVRHDTAAVELTPDIIPPSSALGKRSRHRGDVKDNKRKLKVEPLPSIPELNTDTDKARSETYKQAWSVSEQHLLERLLEEIPEGERNRWAKISQAMGGNRTPRQVASRVQKYFEKLKRFGVGVEKKSKANNL